MTRSGLDYLKFFKECQEDHVVITSGPTRYSKSLTFLPEFPLPPALSRPLCWLYSSRIERPSMSELLRFSSASFASSVVSNSTKAKLKTRKDALSGETCSDDSRRPLVRVAQPTLAQHPRTQGELQSPECVGSASRANPYIITVGIKRSS